MLIASPDFTPRAVLRLALRVARAEGLALSRPLLTAYGVKAKLRPAPGSDHHRRRGRHGRRLHAVTWYGWRDFLRAYLVRDPHATIRTTLATYSGLDGFERHHAATALSPWSFADLTPCNCPRCTR